MSLLEAEDLYPSRLEDTPTIQKRQDPVVYRKRRNRDAPLTGEQIDRYRKQGFLFIEGVFSDEEVRIFSGALDTLCASEVVKRSPGTITEPESREVRSIFHVHRASHLFRELSLDKRLVEVARFLLDSEVYIHQSRVNLKPGFKGKEFYWHSDFETWHVEDGMPRMRAVSCSIALTDNTAVNGSLMVIPGSHQYYVSCVGETPEENYKTSLKRQALGVPDSDSLRKLADEGGIAMPTGPAGSVLFFECNTLHGSNGNITPYPRSNVFIVYNSVENALVKPFGPQTPRPSFLGARDFTPLASKEPEYERLV